MGREEFYREREFWEWNFALPGEESNAFSVFLGTLLRRDYASILPRETDLSVLEIGPGLGGVAGAFYERAVFLDFSLTCLKQLAKSVKGPRICASCHALPLRPGGFDVVIVNDVLHHLKGEGVLAESLAQIGAVLRPGGRLYVVDRNPYSLFQKLFLRLSMLVKRLVFAFLPLRSHGSLNEPDFTRADYARIEKVFTRAGQPLFRYGAVLFVLSIGYNLTRAMKAKLWPEKILAFAARQAERFVLSERPAWRMEMLSRYVKN